MITVQVVDEQWRELEELDLGIDTTLLNRVTHDATGLHCLPFIDHYGNTVFNRAQMEPLLTELDSLSGRAASVADQCFVEALRELAQRVRDDVHLYLLFIGD